MDWTEGEIFQAPYNSMHITPSQHVAILGNGTHEILISGPSPQAAIELRAKIKQLLQP